MITKEQIGFESELSENITPEYICNLYPDEILIWVSGSGCNNERTYGKYRVVMQYKANKVYYENTVEDATANQVALYGILEAISHVNKSIGVCVIVATALGFEKGFKGKGANAELVQKIYTALFEKGCTLTEICTPNGSDVIKKYISDNSGGKFTKKDKDDRKQYYKDQYKLNLYNEWKAKVIAVLNDNNVDEEVIEKIKNLQI